MTKHIARYLSGAAVVALVGTACTGPGPGPGPTTTTTTTVDPTTTTICAATTTTSGDYPPVLIPCP